MRMPLIDPHVHLLPELDDGPPSLAAAVAAARAAVADGLGMAICTPHLAVGHYDNWRDRVREAVGRFQQALDASGVDLRVLPGCEALAHPRLPELLAAGRLATLGDHGRHLLLELPWTILRPAVPRFEDIIRALQEKGVQVILAHPERYELVQKQPDWLGGWVERGLLVQVNAGHLLLPTTNVTGRTARLLLERGWVHLLGSDGHGNAHRPVNLGTMLRQLATHYGNALVERATYNAHTVATGAESALQPL